MKRLFLPLILIFLSATLLAGNLILVPVQHDAHQKEMLKNNALIVHYLCDNFIIATDNGYTGAYTLLDENPWSDAAEYFLVWFHQGNKGEYNSMLSGETIVMNEASHHLILKVPSGTQLRVPLDGRLTRISSAVWSPVKNQLDYVRGSLMSDPEIIEMMNDVDHDLYMENLQHLQDYGTRNAYEPESVEAQNWIKEQFESYGYTNVELFDFWMPSGAASDNVIAYKTGSLYPDEYVVLGAHYDTYSWSGAAPGADDNGTGTCGVLEVARVMAEYEFDRSIIFCTFSGEEYGLYGSAAYAEWCADENMNILGYFNIDMCGYLQPGGQIHTDIIAPSSAQPLVDFYTDVCAMYLPDFIVNEGYLSGGDSDHTSFNNNGYMGIFPFEDDQNYSPYIHSSDDVIGLSVNNSLQAIVFTKAMVANVASMANYLAPPSNLVASVNEGVVYLSWGELYGIDNYFIYRNNEPEPYASVTDPYFEDANVEEFETYSYYVTAVYTDTGDETSPSNTVEVTILPSMALPFFDDFETGGLYWSMEDSWGLSTQQAYSDTYAMTESPNGEYGNEQEISSTLFNFSLENAESAEISFYARWELETNYDYMYFQISTNGTNWTTLETFNGFQENWTMEIFSLEAYLGEPMVLVRFYFDSDYSVTEDGMYIDDFLLDVEETSTDVIDPIKNINISIAPNPFSASVLVQLNHLDGQILLCKMMDLRGNLVYAHEFEVDNGSCSFVLERNNLSDGIYYLIIESGTQLINRKLILVD